MEMRERSRYDGIELLSRAVHGTRRTLTTSERAFYHPDTLRKRYASDSRRSFSILLRSLARSNRDESSSFESLGSGTRGSVASSVEFSVRHAGTRRC